MALDEAGDILIYGCDVASGADGQALIDTISHLTGADVAASIDKTGGVSAGGDWTWSTLMRVTLLANCWWIAIK